LQSIAAGFVVESFWIIRFNFEGFVITGDRRFKLSYLTECNSSVTPGLIEIGFNFEGFVITGDRRFKLSYLSECNPSVKPGLIVIGFDFEALVC
jgi:hypothetical protein